MAKREVDLGSIMGPRWTLPDLYFDPEEAELYRGPETNGYEFKVEDGDLYYRYRT